MSLEWYSGVVKSTAEELQVVIVPVRAKYGWTTSPAVRTTLELINAIIGHGVATIVATVATKQYIAQVR